MDKRIVAALALASISTMASAITVCSGAQGDGATIDGSTDGSIFVRVTFQPKCSANVQLDYTMDATTFTSCSNSRRGKNNFGGTNTGGGVASVGTCTVDASNQCASAAAVAPTTAANATCGGADIPGTML